MIEDFIQAGIKFASFGTNDLIQYTLAIDRNNENVADMYKPQHPAVLNLIDYAIQICRAYNVECSICGQAGSDPKMAEWLVEHGITSISANIDAIAKIREAVARTEKRIILEAARRSNAEYGLRRGGGLHFSCRKEERGPLPLLDPLLDVHPAPSDAVRAHCMFMETNLGDPGLFPGTAATRTAPRRPARRPLPLPGAAGYASSGGTESNIQALRIAKARRHGASSRTSWSRPRPTSRSRRPATCSASRCGRSPLGADLRMDADCGRSPDRRCDDRARGRGRDDRVRHGRPDRGPRQARRTSTTSSSTSTQRSAGS